MSDYIYFTAEQKERANHIDLVDFLRNQGEQLEKSGHEWRWSRHHEITVKGCTWYSQYDRRGGFAIDFVRKYYNLLFPEAVNLLLGNSSRPSLVDDLQYKIRERKPFALPEANHDMRRVYAYLMKKRFIDRDIITHFAHEKMLYEDAKYHNAIFVGYDENGVAHHAHKKGTYINDSSFRGNVDGSLPEYSFHHIGTSDTLYVFEAPIDMMSFITLHKNNWQQYSYVALNCVAEHAMLYQLRQHSHLQKVILCVDHDEAGIEAAYRLKDILNFNGYFNVSQALSEFKDWDEDLKALNGMTPIPAKEHPKIELCRDICRNFSESLKDCKYTPDIINKFTEYNQRLVRLTDGGKVSQGKEQEIMEKSYEMAVMSLCLAKERRRQICDPISNEQLINELNNLYLPHKDKDMLRSKLFEIESLLKYVKDQMNASDIQTQTEKENQISSIMNLALSSVKVHIFAYLEQENQLDQSSNNKMECMII